MNNLSFWLVLLIAMTSGCTGAAVPGTEEAAREYVAEEFKKWMAGQETEVATMKSETRALLPPISYSIRSVVSDKPHPLAFDKTKKLPADWATWPAYRFNVAIEWKSEAETPIEKITTYTLTWDPHGQRWYVHERFL